ncbi:arginase family protein [Vicingaceae bacterium]|nr:arginase family protein [Vicingaceae bacterium]
MELELLNRESLDKLIGFRKSETKLGEQLLIVNSFTVEDLKASVAKFVLIGISEDIGPRANLGKAGAAAAWDAFLAKFVNMQSNRYLNGNECVVLGKLSLNQLCQTEQLDDLRTATEAMDDVVTKALFTIYKAGKIPIIIGGGHNNSYNNIKALALANQEKAINCINLDPHADFRALEGRHSGNGFSYAHAEGYLKKYAIVGLHEGYNSESMLTELDRKGINYSTFEAIFIREEITFKTAINNALMIVNQSLYGIEIDLDAVENVASSAQTPSGISVIDARKFTHTAANSSNAAYLHLCEAAPSLSQQPDQIGKLLAYLATDFIKSRKTF